MKELLVIFADSEIIHQTKGTVQAASFISDSQGDFESVVKVEGK